MYTSHFLGNILVWKDNPVPDQNLFSFAAIKVSSTGIQLVPGPGFSAPPPYAAVVAVPEGGGGAGCPGCHFYVVRQVPVQDVTVVDFLVLNQ